MNFKKLIGGFIAVLIVAVGYSQNRLINDNFDSGSMAAWTVSSGAFSATTDSPINGSSSAQDATTGGATSIATQKINISPDAGEMIWQFQVKIGDFNPSSGNNFAYALISDQQDLSGIQNGFVVGINQASPNDDNLKLYKYTNGSVITPPLLDTKSGGVIKANSTTGIKVTRSITGEWEMFVDFNGGFDNLISVGKFTDTDHSLASYYTGFMFKHSSSRKQKFWIDDVIVSTGGSTTPQVNITANKNTAKEGESFTVTVKTTTAVSENTTFNITTSGTASSSDYNGSAASITINAGSFSNSIVIKTIPDAEVEQAETITFTVSGTDAIPAGATPSKTVYIADYTRVMHYNLLRYPDCKLFNTSKCTANEKNGYLNTILGHVQPDIFGVNEMMSADTTNPDILLNNALNASGRDYYKRAKIDHPTRSEFINMLYYNSNKFELVGQDAIIPDGIREANAYHLKYKNDVQVNGDSIYLTIIQCHLKASACSGTNGDPQNCTDRTTAAQAIMGYINNKGVGNYIVMGDLNIYSSSETAYQTFINYSANPSISFTDPLGKPGAWSSNENFASVHTQSTRFNSNERDDNGVFGGLDDRFDFLLTSNKLFNGERGVQFHPNSYTTVGNDGEHYNGSIIEGTNNSAPSEVIKALHANSDHLPITADFDILSKLAPTAQNVPDNDPNGANPPQPEPTKPPVDPNPPAVGIFEIEEYEQIEVSVYPNPNNGSFYIDFNSEERNEYSVNIFDLVGSIVYNSQVDALVGNNQLSMNLNHLPAGTYIVQLISENKRSYSKVIIE